MKKNQQPRERRPFIALAIHDVPEFFCSRYLINPVRLPETLLQTAYVQ
ncbi:MAG: hypothetical protein ACLFTB_00040 [Desulfovibrionales bacterium]